MSRKEQNVFQIILQTHRATCEMLNLSKSQNCTFVVMWFKFQINRWVVYS